MAFRNSVVLALIVLWLFGCAPLSQSLIAVDGSPVGDLSQVARISEYSERPLLLRGVDRVPLDTLRVPGAFGSYAYAVKAGRHTLWVMSLPYGHPLVPQRIRCYVIDVELEGGVSYLLEEAVGEKRALVLREDAAMGVASGVLVDEPWIFAGSCKWP